MEKLKELLNEYEPRIAGDGEHMDNIRLFRTYMSDKTVRDNAVRYIVSREYEFIKRLIDKNKIDRNLVDWAILHKTRRLLEDDYWVENMNKQYYEKTLMLLAISEKPLELLDSILK